MSEWVSIRRLMPWVTLIPYLAPPSRHAESSLLLEKAGFTVCTADLASVTDEWGLQTAIYDALPMPEGFGTGWNSLNDALGEWQRGTVGPIALLLSSSDAVLRVNPHVMLRAAHLLQDLSQEAEAFVRETGFQFEIIYFGEFNGQLQHGDGVDG